MNKSATIQARIDPRVKNKAQKILNKLAVESFDPVKYVEKEGLKSVADEGALKKFCQEAIDENPDAIADFKSGNEKSLNFIVGQVMRKTKGTASPGEVNKLLRELLK